MTSRPVSRLARRLWIVFAIFIVYGTTIPFHFSGGSAAIADRLSHVHLNPLLSPAGRRASVSDMVQNVLLFLPFGALGMLARPKSGSVWLRIGIVTCLAIFLSAAVEAAQLFTADRITSLNDLATDALGGLLGAIGISIAERVSGRWLRALIRADMVDSRTFYWFLVAAGLVCISAWEPFDVSIDVGTIVGKVRLFSHDVWQYTGLSDEGTSVIHYALFAAAASTWLATLRVRRAAFAAVLVGVPIAFALEGSQLFITSRMPGLEDAAVGAAGVVLGAVLWSAGRRVRAPWAWAVLLAIATGMAAGMEMHSPFARAASHTAFERLSHVIEISLLYAPVGFVFGILWATPRRAAFAAGVVTLLIAVPIEYGQHWIVGRYPDITDIAMSVAGAWIGAWTATYGATMFQELVAETTAPSPSALGHQSGR